MILNVIIMRDRWILSHKRLRITGKMVLVGDGSRLRVDVVNDQKFMWVYSNVLFFCGE